MAAEDVQEAIERLNDELRERGIEITANVKRQVAQIASDEVVVERMRGLIDSGAPIDVPQYMTFRNAYQQSRATLLGRDTIGPSSLEVQLVRKGEGELWDERNRLFDENEALRAEIKTLRGKLGALEVPA
jgi:hypothetical protein